MRRKRRGEEKSGKERRKACTSNEVVKTPFPNTHPDSLHHEADVSDALEVCTLVDGVNSFDMAGDLQTHTEKRLKIAKRQIHTHIGTGLC